MLRFFNGSQDLAVYVDSDLARYKMGTGRGDFAVAMRQQNHLFGCWDARFELRQCSDESAVNKPPIYQRHTEPVQLVIVMVEREPLKGYVSNPSQ